MIPGGRLPAFRTVPFLSDAFWNALAGLGPSAATLIGTVLVARVLGREQFGEFSLVQSSVVAFGLYAPIALGATGAKGISALRLTNRMQASEVRRQTARVAVIVSLACGIGVVVAADRISEGAFGDARVTHAVLIGGVGVVVLGVLATVTGSLSGYGRFREVAVVGLVRGVVTVPCLGFGAWAGGVGGAVGGLVFAGACALGAAGLLLRHYEPMPPARSGIRKGVLRELLVKFSLPVLIGPGLFVLVNALLSYLIAAGPGGAEEVALWNAAMQVRLLILFVPTTLATPILVSVSSARSIGDRQRVRDTVRIGVAVVAAAGVLPSAVIWFTRERVLSVFGESFSGAGSLVETVVLASVISTIPFVIESALRGAGYAWSALSITVLWAGFVLGTAAVFPERSAQRMADVFLYSYVAVLPLAVWLWFRAQGGMWKGSP